MHDRYNRNIHYLRISVTDRCNLRCRYCMPRDGVALLRHEDILSFGEIFSIANVAVDNGVDKIRITGGEPLTRKDISVLIERLSRIDGLKDISMTTNGILLKKHAKSLKNSGLNRVNVSVDTLDPEKYREITCGGDLKDVLQGVDAAEEAGLSPIKINCVVRKTSREPDAVRVKAFCEGRGFQVRFIHEMSLENGKYAVVEGGTGGDCKVCNKLRLSSDGNLRPCLFSDLSYNVRTLGAEEAFRMAVEAKPECGTRSLRNSFHSIGG